MDKGYKPKQGILTLNIKDTRALYSAYMPFVQNGGLFIPTDRFYNVGDEIFVLLSLMNESERIPISGRVVWITPRAADRFTTPGVGIQFGEDDNGATRQKIETFLAGMLESSQPTYTM